MSAIPFQKEIFYPESDGEPMAESDLHRKEMTYLIDSLGDHFLPVPDVYVAGNLFLYYAQGDPRSVVAPDTFVIKGVSKRDRKTYKLWEEGKVPCLTVEVTSDTTRDEDLDRKKSIYQRLGVEDYILFDPLGDYLDPRLQGYRLVQGRYRPVRPERDGSLISQAIGVTFRIEGGHLRLTETPSGKPLLRYEESMARMRRTEARLAEEIAARRASEKALRATEDENARLRAEIERLRKTD